MQNLPRISKPTEAGERWALRLTEFNFEVAHIRGKNNEDADCLSRQHVASVASGWKHLRQQQDNDLFLQEALKKTPHPYEEKDGVWYFRNDLGQLRLFFANGRKEKDLAESS